MTDELTLEIGGRAITGWDSVRVTRGIERLPSDFDLSLVNYDPNVDQELANHRDDELRLVNQLVAAGEPCVIKIGDDVVITGYTDRIVRMLSPDRHESRVVGRGKCQDLVDASAEWDSNVMMGCNVFEVAQKLSAVYGIDVKTDVTDFPVIPHMTINWGESPQEIIERLARWSAVLQYDLPDGSLYLTRVGDTRAASGVKEGENIEYAIYNDSTDQRFSEYIGLSQSIAPMLEVSPANSYGGTFLARGQDPEFGRLRNRRKIIIVESTMIASRLTQQCVDWEMNRRYGRSKELMVIVDSWRDSNGVLWTPNTLIPVELPIFGLEQQLFLLAEVTFERSRDGTTAQLILMPPEAFTVQPYAFYDAPRELFQ